MSFYNKKKTDHTAAFISAVEYVNPYIKNVWTNIMQNEFTKQLLSSWAKIITFFSRVILENGLRQGTIIDESIGIDRSWPF